MSGATRTPSSSLTFPSFSSLSPAWHDPLFQELGGGGWGVSGGGFLDHLCIFSFSKQPFLLKITTLLTSVRTQSHCIQKQGSECGVPGVSLGAHGVRNPEEFIRGLQKLVGVGKKRGERGRNGIQVKYFLKPSQQSKTVLVRGKCYSSNGR